MYIFITISIYLCNFQNKLLRSQWSSLYVISVVYCIIRCGLSGIPKVSLSFHVSLEALTELRKAVIVMVRVFTTKKTHYSQQRIKQIEQNPEEMRHNFPVVSRSRINIEYCNHTKDEIHF